MGSKFVPKGIPLPIPVAGNPRVLVVHTVELYQTVPTVTVLNNALITIIILRFKHEVDQG
jgi:hypothetical protein